MKRFFDKFLLVILWLTIVVLATTFWMNLRYSFNILSGAHWSYLSELQARQANVKFDFYISLVVALVIGLVGLYILIKPKRTKTDSPSDNKPTVVPEQPQIAAEPRKPIMTRPASPIAGSIRTILPSESGAPVRNMQPPKPTLNPTGTQNTQSPNPLFDEITSFFESNDYIVKNCTKVDNLIKPVMAIGYDQTIWLASSNISAQLMQESIDSLVAIFGETLGDTANDITVRGCIVHATNDGTPESDLIIKVQSTDELRDYIGPNQKPSDYDSELFDAFLTYMDTLNGYLGK